MAPAAEMETREGFPTRTGESFSPPRTLTAPLLSAEVQGEDGAALRRFALKNYSAGPLSSSWSFPHTLLHMSTNLSSHLPLLRLSLLPHA